jgi:uncharacterized membrane protein YfcA
MVLGTVIGVGIGAQIIEYLERYGLVDLVVGWTYVLIMLFIGGFMLFESLRATHLMHTLTVSANEVVAFSGIAHRFHSIKIPPMISLPISGIQSISIWTILFVGLLSGLLAGFLGIGGGFIRMPMLVYIIGAPTHVAIGTDLFEIIFSAGFGTISHALKGNVDILIALVMNIGAAIGAQIGALSTRFFVGPRIRLIFSILPFIGAALVQHHTDIDG